MHEYLSELNESQREAVVSTEGPALVIAGAGSGKTRVLTYRIAHLLNLGIPPWRIIALTFTNKAAKEMKERISKIVDNHSAKHLWMGTFHAIFARILRREAEYLKYKSNFTIYDTDDSKSLIKRIIKELQIDDKAYKPSTILSRISSAKNDLLLPNAYMDDMRRTIADKYAKIPLTGEIYRRYMTECFKAGAMDFDDLLLNTNILFRDFPEVLEKYRELFAYILVDEYQDTNFSQYIIIKHIASKHNNICVVGDDAQSIYSFRGARIENILKFEKDYYDFKLFKLEQNYRSTQNIIKAANSLIAKNKGQIPKKLFSKNDIGEKVKVFQAYSDSEEGYIIVNDINSIRSKTEVSLDEIAILYRTNAQSRIFEEALRKNGIPYVIYGGLSFYRRKEIKDVLAYFRIVINPNDSEALKRIINVPARGIGKTTIDRLELLAAQNDTTLWDIITSPNLSSFGFNAGTIKKIVLFVKLISGFAKLAINFSAINLANEIIEKCGIIEELKIDISPENQSRIENINELLNAIQEFSDERLETEQEDSMAHFLEEVSLLTDQDTEKQVDIKTVKLMTVHSAKGLEFEYVYVVGAEENLFPSYMSMDSEAEIEEERRLFYVALTRAKIRAVISYAKSRFRHGGMDFSDPSRFIDDIDPNFVDNDFQFKYKKLENFKKVEPTQKLSTKFYNPISNINSETFSGEFQIGTNVSHDKFGKGIITDLEGDSSNLKATVEFVNVGKKQLMLKFAKLKVI
ncbi:MAG: UvrD-helicase domain-containing protein [Marinilabiliaceae bacterium]|nr:UvrD-helicase domain-containing protein [Marinilabiliaceae bacterium]